MIGSIMPKKVLQYLEQIARNSHRFGFLERNVLKI